MVRANTKGVINVPADTDVKRNEKPKWEGKRKSNHLVKADQKVRAAEEGKGKCGQGVYRFQRKATGRSHGRGFHGEGPHGRNKLRGKIPSKRAPLWWLLWE